MAKKRSNEETYMVVSDDDWASDIMSLKAAQKEAINQLINNANLEDVKIYKLVDKATRIIRFDSHDA